MTEDPDQEERKGPSLALQLVAGLVAAIIAGGAAHIFIGDLITTAVAAIFFGAGAFLTVGRPRGDGSAAGVCAPGLQTFLMAGSSPAGC